MKSKKILIILCACCVFIVVIILYQTYSKTQKQEFSEGFDIDNLKIIERGRVKGPCAAAFMGLFGLKRFRTIISVENENFTMRNLLKQAFFEKNLESKSAILEKFILKSQYSGFFHYFSDSIRSCVESFLMELKEEQSSITGIPECVELLQNPENDIKRAFYYCLTKFNVNTFEITTEESLCLIGADIRVANMQSILDSQEKLHNETMNIKNEEFRDYNSYYLLINLTLQNWTSKWSGSEILKNVTIYTKQYELRVLVSGYDTGDYFVYIKHGNKVLKICGDKICEHDISKNIEGKAKFAIYELVD